MTERTKAPGDQRKFLRYAPLGLVPVMFGAAWVTYLYAWASMVDPALTGWSRQNLILQKMIPGAIPGVVLILLGVFFSVICIFQAAFGSGRVRPTAIRIAALAVVLFASLAMGLMFVLA